ncbi:inactive receptor-like serine/threonine-protein kinase At2g40270 [Durio zibethinus]|uniref:Inactive receptor-like serine/threonine-protein kinase At2g40270 n=1 Tax=Durio zibethinus TaxID=66656 RepID=A0A6P5ZM55_DURZI|nr:inactive receptor-like serine/threonine-protein kinase At2g40270 [Durio zibethinus]
MDGRWGFKRFKFRMMVMMMLMLVLSLFDQNMSFSLSLNSEGLALLRLRDRVVSDPFGALSNWKENDGEIDPCSWFGVECSDGKVISLNLKDLCLVGTLGPEVGKLGYLKSIILRNNSFSGNIPEEIGELKELEVLDFGYNNFSGPFPSHFGDNLSLTTLLLDNNEFLGSMSPELYEVKMLSEFQEDENQLTNAATRPSCKSGGFPWNIAQPGDVAHRRRLQQVVDPSNALKSNERVSQLSSSPSLAPNHLSSPSESPFSPSSSPLSPSLSPLGSTFLSPSASPSSIFLAPSPSPSPTLAPTPGSQPPVDPPVFTSEPPLTHSVPTNSPASTPNLIEDESAHSKHHMILILVGSIGGSLFVLISVLSIFLFRRSKVVTVKPWATGLSGQLQKAFVTGVPQLKRSELEAACEDFSNIIGTFSDGTVYKGTLSSGVEIALTSTAVASREDWSKNLETQFRKKIETLSKVNHKNLVNLIGYCEENVPFTRMMVFEYAPNGTLFEHLHIQEAEHLDRGMRLRIAMGIAYCLEHMHQQNPPIAHRNLKSCSVYLTEDYAAKISDFSLLNNATAAKVESATKELLQSPSADAESNVYSFGVILFEMITGRIPYSVGNASLADWASDYLKRDKPLKEMVDPTLKFFQEDELEKLFEVIKTCVHPDPKERPTMKEIASKLKEITAIDPDGATPKLSPLWWAELEILSAEAS